MDTTNLSPVDILNAALALPEDSRRQLADDIFSSIKPPGVWSVDDPGFPDELERRVQALDSGEDPGVAHDEMMREFRAQIATARKNRKN